MGLWICGLSRSPIMRPRLETPREKTALRSTTRISCSEDTRPRRWVAAARPPHPPPRIKVVRPVIGTSSSRIDGVSNPSEASTGRCLDPGAGGTGPLKDERLTSRSPPMTGDCVAVAGDQRVAGPEVMDVPLQERTATGVTVGETSHGITTRTRHSRP